VNGTVVTCPFHGARFDVTTGQVLGPPAARGVGRYDVRVEGEDVKIEIA
jgi:nitrite reductase/ring-hydroxylating ferredoxin subunit